MMCAKFTDNIYDEMLYKSMNEIMYTIWYMYCMDVYELRIWPYEQLEHVVDYITTGLVVDLSCHTADLELHDAT